MKKVDIIYFGSLQQVQGVNYVTNSFIVGKDYFFKKKIILNKIYSDSDIINVLKGEDFAMGSGRAKVSFKLIRIFRTYLQIILSSKYPIFALLKLYLNFLRPAQRVINKYINENNGDLIIFQDVFTAFYYYKKVKDRRKKSIVILHSGKNPYAQLEQTFPGIFNSRLKWIIEDIFKNVYQNCDKIIYISNRALSASPLKSLKKDFIYNGIPDLSKFVLSPTKEKLNLVCVGSITERKGQELIIEAVNKLDPIIKNKIKVYIVGAGDKESDLKSKVIRYNLSEIINFTGVRDDVDKLLEKMDIFILPSSSEGLPISLIEALRQGLYILVTKTGGTSEMINNNFGEIISRDPKDIQDKITEIISNNKVNLNSKSKAREFYLQNFTLKKMINKYAEILTSL
jgi:glycosyltransferase involved in cell wall biosynthesis